MTAPTRRGPGVGSPDLVNDLAGGGSIYVDSTPGPRRIAAAAIDVATILPAIGGKVDEATFRQVETTVVRTVDLLLAVEGVLCRPDVDPDQEAALVARRAELVGGAA